MKNREVLKRLNVEAAKEAFSWRYDAVMRMLETVSPDYGYDAITVRFGETSADPIEIQLHSREFDHTVAIRKGKLVSALDKWETQEVATASCVVPVRLIINNPPEEKNYSIQFKERMK